jgi:hypothetical protein
MFLSCPRRDLSSASPEHKTIATPVDSPAAALRALTAAVFLLVLFSGFAAAQTNPKHFFWAPGQPQTPNPNSLASDLIYHGGNAGPGAIGVENKPATYLIFWGPAWQNGFTTTDVNGVL